MTFLHDPEDIRSFFGAPESLIGFQAAAEPWTAVSTSRSLQHPRTVLCSVQMLRTVSYSSALSSSAATLWR